MMKHNKGFSLIELMIYMTILSLVSLMIMQHVMKSIASLTTVRSRGNAINALHHVASLMVRDIQAACARRDAWKKISSDNCVFPVDDYDCGWLLRKGILYRIKGSYNAGTDDWKKKKKQRVLLDVNKITFVLSGDEKMIRSVTVLLSINIQGGVYTMKQCAIPRSMVTI